MDEKKYKIARYFDDVFEQFVAYNMNKEEAEKKLKLLNRQPRYYVSYEIKPE
jgi:hypothetical protein